MYPCSKCSTLWGFCLCCLSSLHSVMIWIHWQNNLIQFNNWLSMLPNVKITGSTCWFLILMTCTKLTKCHRIIQQNWILRIILVSTFTCEVSPPWYARMNTKILTHCSIVVEILSILFLHLTCYLSFVCKSSTNSSPECEIVLISLEKSGIVSKWNKPMHVLKFK